MFLKTVIFEIGSQCSTIWVEWVKIGGKTDRGALMTSQSIRADWMGGSGVGRVGGKAKRKAHPLQCHPPPRMH